MDNLFKATLTIIVSLMITLIIYLSWEINNSETDKLKLEFRENINELVFSLEKEISLNLQSLYFLNNVFHTYDEVTPAEFKKLSTPVLKRLTSIQALEWIPKVEALERELYEKKHQTLYPKFAITQRDSSGGMVVAQYREIYFPVYYLEPFKGNEKALGYDLASSKTRLDALKESAKLKKLRITASIQLVQDKEKQKGFLAFSPIYKENNISREELQGFVLGVFKIRNILKPIEGTKTKNIIYSLIDSSTEKNDTLYTNNSNNVTISNKDFTYKKDLNDFGGRHWYITAVPTDKYIAEHRSYLPYATLFFGIILVLLSAYLIYKQRMFVQLLLQKSEKRFTLAMQGANDGLWDWDLISDEVYYSPRWLSMLGYKEGELSSNLQTLKELCTAKDVEKVMKTLDTSFKEHADKFEVNLSMKHKNGRKVDILSRAKIIWDKEKSIPIRITGTHVDVTSYKKLEAKLRRTAEIAKKATVAKSNFLANMSHEIRTPMNAILGFVENLSKTETDTKRIDQFKIIEESTHSLLTIINDILDFSKIESGNIKLEKHPFSSKEIFQNTAIIFQDIALKKELIFNYNISEKLPAFLIGDSVRIKQIISNLLSNAIKFTPENGKVDFNISYNKNTNELSCEIIDTGIGIKSKNINSIFNSFEQADSSTTRKYGGTGLGLSISSKLTHLMGSKLNLTSKPNEGSCFYFTIQIFESKEDNTQEDKEVQNTQSKHYNSPILIVEDNKTNQLLLSMILDDLEIRYEVAENGLEAIEYFNKKSYAIILMDINMPILNGIEATKEIQKLEKERGIKQTPIIAVTANALIEDKEKFLSAGMIGYISKPYSQKEIQDTIIKYYEN